MEKIEGTLYAYYREETEKFYWTIREYGHGEDSYFSLLKDGQSLIVYDDSNNVYWGGNVKKDLSTYLSDDVPHPRQVVQGFDVHCLQEDVAPEKWASMFLSGMRAELYLDDKLKDDTVSH